MRLISLVGKFGSAASVNLDQDDIVQEAFMALWQLSQKGYPIRNAEALLVRITKNICVSRYRKQKNRLFTIIEEAVVPADPSYGRLESRDDEKIRQLLYETLTKTEREYMEMKTDEEMSLDEMAIATGKTKESIKTALSKARKKLMDAFKTNGYE